MDAENTRDLQRRRRSWFSFAGPAGGERPSVFFSHMTLDSLSPLLLLPPLLFTPLLVLHSLPFSHDTPSSSSSSTTTTPTRFDTSGPLCFPWRSARPLGPKASQTALPRLVPRRLSSPAVSLVEFAATPSCKLWFPRQRLSSHPEHQSLRHTSSQKQGSLSEGSLA